VVKHKRRRLEFQEEAVIPTSQQKRGGRKQAETIIFYNTKYKEKE